MRRIPLVLPLGLILLLFFASAASAQMNVRLRVIVASNDGRAVDSSLRDLHRQLGSLFNFTSYRLIREDHLALYPSLPAAIQARPGRFIEVTLVRQYREGAEVKVRVIREGRTFQYDGRFFPGRTVLIGAATRGPGDYFSYRRGVDCRTTCQPVLSPTSILNFQYISPGKCLNEQGDKREGISFRTGPSS
jgi:hypothetical protein